MKERHPALDPKARQLRIGSYCCLQDVPRDMFSSNFLHVTLSLYTAMNPQPGELMGQTAERHTSQAFVGFLQAVADRPPSASVSPSENIRTYG